MPSKDLQRVLNHIRQTSKSEREKGSRFEKLMRDFFKHDSIYKNQFKEVWTWREYPQRKHKDLGIDLVAETYNGEKVAIQCKCYKEDTPLSKENIDSFLSELGKKDFQEGIIVSTTDNWSDNAEKALSGRSKKCVRIGITELEESDISDWWTLYKKAKASQPSKKRLRQHQKNALKDVIKGFKAFDRGKLIMPCGTGKTFTALKIAENVTKSNGKILILMPSLSLVSQTHREFMQNSAKEINAFIVCSDKKAGKDIEDIGNIDLAVPPTTDYKKLSKKNCSAPKGQNRMTVIFSTYHSIEVISKAQKTGKMGEFDLIICDEAHRTTGVEGKTKTDDKKSYWTRVHDNNFVKAAKRLYMTATPRVYTEKAKEKAESKNYETYSMDDESVYGKNFYELKFSEAISQGLLSDYKVVVLAVNEDAVSASMQKAFAQDKEVQTDDAVKIIGCWNALAKKFVNNKNINLYKKGYKDIKERRPMQRAVAFSNTIAASEQLRKYFQKVVDETIGNNRDRDDSLLKCEIHHVDGSMNSLTRGREIRWLKGESEVLGINQCRILSNARCLSEGVDVPALDAVMFLQARKSEIDIVQSVGRVMRKPSDPNQKKEFGYIILPIVIRPGLKPSEALDDNQRYQVIWKVVQALRSHDDRLETAIDKLPYSRKLPANVVIKAIGKDEDGLGKAEEEVTGELNLAFAEDWQEAVVAKLVLKCGDREYLDKIAVDVASAFQNLSRRIQGFFKGRGPSKYKKTLDQFLGSLRAVLNESVTQDQAVEMLAIHSVTKPLFQALFETRDNFTNQNPVSRSMEEALLLFGNQITAETKALRKSYEDIKKRVRDIDTLESRQNLIKELYQIVFKKSFPKIQEQLGIVYTPIEIVDFILESSHEILKREFGVKNGFSEKNITVIDPFSGTGTFLTRLIENKNLIKDVDLKRKYDSEIFSVELILLAYYITTINIESSYHFRKRERNKRSKDLYERYQGAIFADTFQATEEVNRGEKNSFFQENIRRRKRLKKEEIRVVVGNPPYSAGQRSENDNNKNLKYETLDKKIKETYAEASKSGLKKGLYDSYIRAIKWATERINKNSKGGIVSFVTNASFLDNVAMDGLRYHLAKDFTDLYIFHLRGNARTKGEQRRKEGGEVFGQSSRCPIAISLLIKNPRKTGCKIHYYDIGDYLSTKQKLEKVQQLRHIFNIKWQKITPDKHNDWVNQRDGTYESFIPMGDKHKKSEKIFTLHSLGVVTNRDSWVYNFDKSTLSKNVKKTISFYNREVERFKRKGSPNKVDKFINNDNTRISWSGDMKSDLVRKKFYNYDKKLIRNSMYRPFCRMHLYYGRTLNERIYQTHKIYPDSDTKNLAICTSGKGAKTFSVLMTEITPDLQFLGNCQHFPRYIYQNHNGKMKRSDNISKDTVKIFRTHYQDKSLNADDIFFYIYGLLHSKQYGEKYENDLLKALPRIPMVNDFHEFSRIGKKLSDLHVNYERVQKYKGLKISNPWAKGEELRVKKMRYQEKGNTTSIIYNDRVTISSIPKKAHEYQINGYSAVRWIMERYQVKKCKKSGIINDPNRKDEPRYILDLLQRIVYVSVESIDLIDQLPEITDWGILDISDLVA